MTAPQWEWRLEVADGTRHGGAPGPVFTSQYDAEQWLGEHWRELAADGIAAAVLLNDGTRAAPPVDIPAV
ncbi:hypothetical protein GCM10025865_26020 [Paraoerskovia sediminicola]|uniref:Uncharacterized protein n=1 Tax=Paraoerskovia sediminicola TaxID=1138587 RepID=A0ABM8G5D3_9CELL|nr:hypothetical protein [Paraoerskovia sediminicola]BDZ43303.1 hypothetical protein GCM10025865_26020 [Paraoerskovia sediminicola]